MVRAYVMGNDSIVAGGFIFGSVVALQKIMIECNGHFILILGVHGLKGTMGPGTGVSGPGDRGPEKIPFTS